MSQNGLGVSDAFEAGKKQGRTDILEEILATTVTIEITEYEALKECEAACRQYSGLCIMKAAIAALDKARGK